MTKKSILRIFSASCAVVLMTAAGLVSAEPAPEAAASQVAFDQKHAEIAHYVFTLADRYHYRQDDVDREFSAKVFDRYIENLDGNRQYFLRNDLESFKPYREEIVEYIEKGELEPAYDIFSVYQERSRDRIKFALKILEEEPDFTLDETFVFDRSEAPWAANLAELDDLWRKRVKNDALSLALAGKDWAESQEILTKRYTSFLKRVDQINSDDVFEIFMNAFTHILDPHSSYLSPRNSEEYRIQMSLSYDGIGASLQLQDDYVTIMGIIPGGPAAGEGTLKPNDRITGVAQGIEGEIVDVVGWRLDDVVQLIRGPGGTDVRLQILPANAAPGTEEFLLTLTRDKIKLEAQAAQKKIVTVPREDREWRIGVIEVPSFYMDYQAMIAGDDDYTSTTADVRRLIGELQQEGMDGLVVDLRGNGGGHLAEARALSGLFIPRGPVVQLRQSNGRIEVLSDKDPAVAYDGPLAVLVDRYSASASEIFAAAIQDYGRGVVVGQQTFGKGTVQNLFPLDRFKRQEGPGFGQLTLTIGKYYRVSGDSTQHRGVSPDISLPSAINAEVVGESTRPSALPWDHIDATDYVAARYSFEDMENLQARHSNRINENPDYVYLQSDIEELRQARERKSVSLNLETRRTERENLRQSRLEKENARREAHGLEPHADLDAMEASERPDFILEEASEVVVDMADLQLTAKLDNRVPPAVN